MEDFRFVHESPQSQQVHRKRPRLVTACDNCRIKKIRCVKPQANEKCEACTAGNVACEFRDRERYFQERSRLIASSSVGSTSSASRRPTTPSISPTSYSDRRRSPYARPPRLDDSPPSSVYSYHSDPSPRNSSLSLTPPGDRYLGYKDSDRHSSEPPEFHPVQQTHHNHSRSTPGSYTHTNDGAWNYPSDYAGVSTSYNPAPSLHSSPQSNLQHVQLFEPSLSDYPSFTLMPHFITLFFENLGNECTYLSHDDVLGRFLNQSLPSTIANAIACLAVRFSDLPQLAARGLRSIADTYNTSAKTHLSAVISIPSLDTLHALMLISMSEYKTGRIAGLIHYSDMAMRMALDMGLSDDQTMHMTTSARERHRLQTTWNGVWRLHIAATSYNGSS